MSEDVRKKFLDFFVSAPRNHKEIPSSPLIPENDPTVLFITAGMHPLVPYLMGEEHPLGKRLCDVQKSVRTDDIEEVGDLRHFTFFEMLGNWSLGDYFKKEAIQWSFEFLTEKKWLGFDPSKIYVSIFEGDQDAPMDKESAQIWSDVFARSGIKAETGSPNQLRGDMRIFPYPKKKNWWGPAGQTGPCGPDTEIFFDTGLMLHDEKTHGKKCHINCDCGRFVEVWNNVFMEYNKTSDGGFVPLAQKNVDTGMGLERVTALTEWLSGNINHPDPFLTFLFKRTVEQISLLSGKEYTGNEKNVRTVADHIRASVFMLSDGVVPSNKERGYILRRLIRRAIRSGHVLGIDDNFLRNLSSVVIEDYQKYYPELAENREKIMTQLEAEEIKFRHTLKQGLKEIKKIGKIDGKKAFNLYQSYGFPLELTYEIVKEQGTDLDISTFRDEFKKHQEISRTATKGLFRGGLQDDSEKTTRLHTATHLLQQALRKVLGPHVRQKGSHITHERLRFDFSHNRRITADEISKIEKEVNSAIEKNLKVSVEILTLDEALKRDALTVPGANYPEKVKVYSVGDYSTEVCGGPHVNFTGSLGSFKILKEEATGEGIRRIYAKLDSL